MNGPPTDIPASELWLKLAQKERPSKVVDFPRKDEDGNPVGQLRIRILTQEEQMASASAAEKTVREHLKEAKRDDLGYDRLFTDAYCVEVLFRACRDVNDSSKTLFPSPKQLRQALTTEECSMLFQHYWTVSVELGPTVVNMTDEELESWIDRLAEGGSAFPFDLLSSDLQRIVLAYMASQLRKSPTDSTSAGLPLEESTPSD
jgi:hypothetical protein